MAGRVCEVVLGGLDNRLVPLVPPGVMGRDTASGVAEPRIGLVVACEGL